MYYKKKKSRIWNFCTISEIIYLKVKVNPEIIHLYMATAAKFTRPAYAPCLLKSLELDPSKDHGAELQCILGNKDNMSPDLGENILSVLSRARKSPAWRRLLWKETFLKHWVNQSCNRQGAYAILCSLTLPLCSCMPLWSGFSTCTCYNMMLKCFLPKKNLLFKIPSCL